MCRFCYRGACLPARGGGVTAAKGPRGFFPRRRCSCSSCSLNKLLRCISYSQHSLLIGFRLRLGALVGGRVPPGSLLCLLAVPPTGQGAGGGGGGSCCGQHQPLCNQKQAEVEGHCCISCCWHCLATGCAPRARPVAAEVQVQTREYMYSQPWPGVMVRSYHHESTRSHQNSEVKRGWARLVLG